MLFLGETHQFPDGRTLITFQDLLCYQGWEIDRVPKLAEQQLKAFQSGSVCWFHKCFPVFCHDKVISKQKLKSLEKCQLDVHFTPSKIMEYHE